MGMFGNKKPSGQQDAEDTSMTAEEVVSSFPVEVDTSKVEEINWSGSGGELLEPLPTPTLDTIDGPGITFVDQDPTMCSVKGLFAATGAGVLGYAFGFVPKVVTFKATKGGSGLQVGRMTAANSAGVASAASFAVLSGMYAAVQCYTLRIRQKQDAWNGGIAGAATGLAIGWKSGLKGAATSAATLAVASFVMEYYGMGSGDAATAATLPAPQGGACKQSGARGRQWRARLLQLSAATDQLLAPSLLLPSDRTASKRSATRSTRRSPAASGAQHTHARSAGTTGRGAKSQSESSSASPGASGCNRSSGSSASRPEQRGGGTTSPGAGWSAQVGAVVTPAAAMLRPVMRIVAPCSMTAGNVAGGPCLRQWALPASA